jgi:hypothetical protein
MDITQFFLKLDDKRASLVRLWTCNLQNMLFPSTTWATNSRLFLAATNSCTSLSTHFRHTEEIHVLRTKKFIPILRYAISSLFKVFNAGKWSGLGFFCLFPLYLGSGLLRFYCSLIYEPHSLLRAENKSRFFRQSNFLAIDFTRNHPSSERQ